MHEDRPRQRARHAYRDSEAVLQHIQNVSKPLGRLVAMSETSLELFGEPSDELIEASRGFAPRIYGAFGG